MSSTRTRILALTTGLLLLPTAALAHPHSSPGHTVANGTSHYNFEVGDLDGDGVVAMESCDSYGVATGPNGQWVLGQSWYGIETAHHGVDAGTPGRADGCFQLDVGTTPATDTGNGLGQNSR